MVVPRDSSFLYGLSDTARVSAYITLLPEALWRLTSALWRAEEGAQRRRASVAHQRAVRARRQTKHLLQKHPAPLECTGGHSRPAAQVRQTKHSALAADARCLRKNFTPSEEAHRAAPAHRLLCRLKMNLCEWRWVSWLVTKSCALTSALWRVVEGAKRRRANVAHQRAVRARRQTKHLVQKHPAPLECTGGHSRPSAQGRQTSTPLWPPMHAV
jgi:hypothetical protein